MIKKNCRKRNFFFYAKQAIIVLCLCYMPTMADASPSDTIVKITDKKAFVPKLGVNYVQFYGVDSNDLKDQKKPVERPSAIIYVENGESYSAIGSYYFLLSGTKKPVVEDSIQGQADELQERGVTGRDYSSAVLIFNGVLDSHCQTFLALAQLEGDEQADKFSTVITIYYFYPGEFGAEDNDDPGYISVQESPSFVLLKRYKSQFHYDDPEISLSKEFFLPLPLRYHADQSDFIKSLSLPSESAANSYLVDGKTGC